MCWGRKSKRERERESKVLKVSVLVNSVKRPCQSR